MRGSLKAILSRVERIRADVVGRAGEPNWDALVARLCSARTERPKPFEMTSEEFSAWSERLRASVGGSSQERLAERLIAARRGDVVRRRQC